MIGQPKLASATTGRVWSPRKRPFSSFSYPGRRMLLLALCLSCGISMLYLRIYQRSWNLLRYDNNLATVSQLSDEVEKNESFLVDTPGCRIPNLPAISRTTKRYFKHQFKDPKCAQRWSPLIANMKQRGPPLVESNLTTMWIVSSALRYYHVKDLEHLSCCYRPFWRIQQDAANYSASADNNFSFSDVCYPFIGASVTFDGISNAEYVEFVLVECARLVDYDNYDENRGEPQYELIYHDFHAFFPLKPHVEDRCKDTRRPDQLSVLILGIDSVSRLNMLRQLPRTHAVLTSPPLAATSLLGYNKVGYNTLPNVVPLLTGLSLDELTPVCWHNQSSKFDSCPFIWNDFASQGYRTAYAEDASTISTFNYRRTGFVKQPTDYYGRPFLYESLRQQGSVGSGVLKLCTGSRQSFHYWLSYVKKFALRFAKERYFGFFWSNIISHNELNMPHIGDALLASTLEELRDSGALEKTVLLVMSDHGIRWGAFRETFQGRMEESLPFLYLSLPESFRSSYTTAMKNLRMNSQNRLTTPFDVHETLRNFLHLDMNLKENGVRTHETEDNNNGTQQRYYTKHVESRTSSIKRSTSLFMPISPRRTCESSGISPQWCSCQKSSPISIGHPELKDALIIILESLNNILRNYSTCATLRLKAIKSAEEKQLRDEDGVALMQYLVTFTTSPGDAVFEATVRKSLTDKSASLYLAGPVSRLNSYGQENYCVTDSAVQLYCYCKIQQRQAAVNSR